MQLSVIDSRTFNTVHLSSSLESLSLLKIHFISYLGHTPKWVLVARHNIFRWTRKLQYKKRIWRVGGSAIKKKKKKDS